MDPDVMAFHKSISGELQVLKDRVRNLIGSAHWPSDGAHKEAIIKNLLRTYLPADRTVGSGFICYPGGQEGPTVASKQNDILIIDNELPVLFRSGEFLIVTPNAVRAIVEVKTQINRSEFKKVVKNLSIEKRRLFSSGGPNAITGLFVYENTDIPDSELLKILKEQSHGDKYQSVDIIAIGPSRFFRLWQTGTIADSPVSEAVWHSYNLEELAPAYFIHNITLRLSKADEHRMEKLWFPIDGGKEKFRQWYCAVIKGGPKQFE
ncbi:MAG: DUF6602 domain-containing protein [Candidatus Krumholzibacteriaceae bacterium]|jgi:hypothetical protein